MSRADHYVSEKQLYREYVRAEKTMSEPESDLWRLNRIRTFRFIRAVEGCLNNKIVLNVGCGRDVLFKSFIEEGATLIECDLIIDPLRELKNKGVDNLVVADVNNLPFRAEAFDIVFCIGLIHHLDPVAEALSEMVVVLKRGGSVYCVEPNRKFLFSMLIDLLPGSLPLRLRQKVLPRLFAPCTPPANYERTLDSEQVEKVLQKLGIYPQCAYNLEAHYALPAFFALLWNKFTILLGIFVNVKSLSFQFTIFGRKADHPKGSLSSI